MYKVLAVTGIRSEYDILYPVIDALREESSFFDVSVVVCGAHLSNFHDFTIQKIEEDNFKIVDKIDSLLMTNRKTQRVKGVGILTNALSQTIERENPDLLITVGDREESIATALVGNYMNTLVAHIGGGDTAYGNADDPVRHAVSKLAHIHFTTSKFCAEVLQRMGEEEWRIFNVGNPALDNIRRTPYKTLDELSKFLQFDIRSGNYIVLIEHPLSSEVNESHTQMETIIEALIETGKEFNIKVIGIYPNTDPGSYDILNAINAIESPAYVRFYKTLPREIFVNVLRHTLCLVGNSSMGFLEAPFYKLPVVNVGNRQRGRLNAGNVEFVDCKKELIKNSILKACYNEEYRNYIANLENPYGDGFASEKIRYILKNIDLRDGRWLIKKLNYLKI